MLEYEIMRRLSLEECYLRIGLFPVSVILFSTPAVLRKGGRKNLVKILESLEEREYPLNSCLILLDRVPLKREREREKCWKRNRRTIL